MPHEAGPTCASLPGVAASMNQPIWLKMKVAEESRKERLTQEAHRKLQQARLPPRMERHSETERLRKSAEVDRMRQETTREFTFQPRISESKTKEDFDNLHRRQTSTPAASSSSASTATTRLPTYLPTYHPMHMRVQHTPQHAHAHPVCACSSLVFPRSCSLRSAHYGHGCEHGSAAFAQV